MKIFTTIKENKYPIAVVAFFSAALLCIFIFIKGLKKDHSMDLFKQKMEWQEQARNAVIKDRLAWEEVMLQQTKTIIALQVRDSLIGAKASLVENKILEISKPKYVKEKITKVESYSNSDIIDYLNKLPEPTDY